MMNRSRRERRYVALMVGLVAVGGVSLTLMADAAAIADPDSPTVTVDQPSSLSVEYGQQWSFSATATGIYFMTQPWTTSAVVHSAPSGYTLETNSYSSDPSRDDTNHIDINPVYSAAPLAVGNYTIDVSITKPEETHTTATPARLSIVPAKLGIELRVVSDPSSPTSEIVTARFTGRFVDEYNSSFYPGSPLSPAGTWKISLVDPDGHVAIERSIERAGGDDVLASSFYWADAEPKTQYVAKATFTPSGASVANFQISPATDFAFTTVDTARPVPTSTATSEPLAPLPQSAGLSLPFGLLLVTGILIAALATLTIIFTVKLTRRVPTAENGEADAQA